MKMFFLLARGKAKRKRKRKRKLSLANPVTTKEYVASVERKNIRKEEKKTFERKTRGKIRQ